MRFTTSFLLAGAAALGLAACERSQPAESNAATSAEASDAAGDKTLASGLTGEDAKFADAAEAAGLDRTLAGPGPYTVLVPDNAAFDKLPAGALDTLMKPEGRAQLTEVLTFHILPGTMLAADIAKAIDAGGGKASLATMGGGTLTATKEGDKVVISDGAGGKATVTGADDQRSNGVIHRIDAVLMPSKA